MTKHETYALSFRSTRTESGGQTLHQLAGVPRGPARQTLRGGKADPQRPIPVFAREGPPEPRGDAGGAGELIPGKILNRKSQIENMTDPITNFPLHWKGLTLAGKRQWLISSGQAASWSEASSLLSRHGIYCRARRALRENPNAGRANRVEAPRQGAARRSDPNAETKPLMVIPPLDDQEGNRIMDSDAAVARFKALRERLMGLPGGRP